MEYYFQSQTIPDIQFIIPSLSIFASRLLATNSTGLLWNVIHFDRGIVAKMLHESRLISSS